MAIKAVLFDVGDTLWHSQDPPSAASLEELATRRVKAVMAANGLDAVPPAKVARCGFKAVEAAILAARRGSLEEPDYAAAARTSFRELGLSVDRRQANDLIEACYVSGLESGKVAFADARPTLIALKERGFLLGVVTNRAFGGERFRSDLRAAGLDVAWDAVCVSVEVGHLKPHPAMFRHALQALAVAPAEALMVGNSLREDVAGAQELGLPAAWLRSVPDADGVVPDFTVDSVSELLALPVLEGLR